MADEKKPVKKSFFDTRAFWVVVGIPLIALIVWALEKAGDLGYIPW